MCVSNETQHESLFFSECIGKYAPLLLVRMMIALKNIRRSDHISDSELEPLENALGISSPGSFYFAITVLISS